MAIVRTSPDHTPVFSEDDILEILSMISEDTHIRMLAQITQARYAAQAELSEQDLSDDAQTLLKRHIDLADKILLLIARSKGEQLALEEKI